MEFNLDPAFRINSRFNMETRRVMGELETTIPPPKAVDTYSSRFHIVQASNRQGEPTIEFISQSPRTTIRGEYQ